jgi:hypothetical protein
MYCEGIGRASGVTVEVGQRHGEYQGDGDSLPRTAQL